MDQERFDRFARGLAAGMSRRRVAPILTGAAIGGIVVAAGGSEAGARKRKRRRGKRQGGGCTPKTCAELGRTCGAVADDGCGNPLDCGGDAVCGNETSTNCCAGKCCKANGIACSSNAECCNGDCLKFLGFGTCNAFTDYTCAP